MNSLNEILEGLETRNLQNENFSQNEADSEWVKTKQKMDFIKREI